MTTDSPQPAAPAPSPAGARTTYFAPAERLSAGALQEQLAHLGNDPLLGTLLTTVGGLLAVLNEHRQILAINEGLLAYLGLGSAESLLGLRLGEIVACPHSREMPGGCGTSQYCPTCGAAIAQAIALHEHQATERLCALESQRNGTRTDLVLRVRATPVALASTQLILVFIDDVTRQQQQALAERSFHHDLNNTLTCLLSASELLSIETTGENSAIAGEVHQLAQRVIRELALQRQLVTSADLEKLTPALQPVALAPLLDELRRSLGHHPAAAAKRIAVATPTAPLTFSTDTAMLQRVLLNMAINALEATAPGGEIRLHASVTGGHLEFSVWNDTPIPPEIALRIFQRNFSTKAALGRGLGTFSMKLVGERLLGGRVWFESAAPAGTTFHFRLPLAPAER